MRLGINREAHYRMFDEVSWHKLGHTIVPPEHWEFLDTPGMRSVIIQGKRPDSYNGFVWLRVEPSVTIEHGVFIQQNDHFELGNDASGEDAFRLIQDVWAESDARAAKAFEHVLALAN
jgi:hypothetical protein